MASGTPTEEQPDGLGPALGWRRAKFPSVPSRAGSWGVYMGGAWEAGARNGYRIISMIIDYNVNKDPEEKRVAKQAGRYHLWNA